MNDTVWCDECGAALGWKHAKQMSERRRRVWWFVCALGFVARMFSRAQETIVTWADRPAREQYERDKGWKK
jgi:hypothetical protein